MKRELIQIDSKGRVELPDWVVKTLLKGLRSKKRRHQKKRVKKRFLELLIKGVKSEAK